GLRRTSIQCLMASRTDRSTQCRYKSNHLGRLLWLPCRVSYLGAELRYRRLAPTLQTQTSLGLRLRPCLIHTTLGRSAPVASLQALPPSKHHAKSHAFGASRREKQQ